jgi:hypothetical protein
VRRLGQWLCILRFRRLAMPKAAEEHADELKNWMAR